MTTKNETPPAPAAVRESRLADAVEFHRRHAKMQQDRAEKAERRAEEALRSYRLPGVGDTEYGLGFAAGVRDLTQHMIRALASPGRTGTWLDDGQGFRAPDGRE
jgi:isocitrate lyase